MTTPPKQNRLAEQRKLSRLDQEEVATLMGSTVATVSRHESGERTPDDTTLKKYAKVYKCETHELFFKNESGQ